MRHSAQERTPAQIVQRVEEGAAWGLFANDEMVTELIVLELKNRGFQLMMCYRGAGLSDEEFRGQIDQHVASDVQWFITDRIGAAFAYCSD